MPRLAHPGPAGQVTDPPEPREPKPRSDAFKLTPEEAQRVRTATRKIANASVQPAVIGVAA